MSIPTRDNPAVPAPPIVVDEIRSRMDSLLARRHDIGHATWSELGAILRIDPDTLRNLATGKRRRITVAKLDTLVVALGLVGYVDVTTGRQLYTAPRAGAVA
ncbi:hypothetical protein [Corynebacterium sp.]|uniref:hypothetical protein n=1 Tax=Corynebacterium sp. TaxID=1720 RepID=UPI0025BFDF3D|nr:hypothetical protein [Corynebacterium sp.]